jgi:uncharacterized membrane protein
MTASLLELPVLVAAIGAFIVAGVFYGFSTFIMQALARVPIAEGIRAMQAINIAVINPWFLGVFMGTALLLLVLAVAAALHLGRPAAPYVVLGAICYVFGCFVLTMGRNVPLNDALSRVDPQSEYAAALWARYLRDWTWWNHVRTFASFVAAVVLTYAWAIT